ncbi:MAG TPA: ornithine cyclodeaminase family protein [Thermoanaerobaculia bacterium]|nr:ornithine cyclodeaminase family protein [Thermoanaerobaculia bacterium]
MSRVDVLVIDQAEVERLLPMADCIDVMDGALRALSEGKAILPLRPVIWTPEKTGALAAMPAFLGEPRCFGIKVITVFPKNVRYDAHQGAVLLFEAEEGRLLAILDATEITAIRTAAVSGLATRLLARDDARTLAILGAGTQARTHLAAVLAVRTISEVRVFSRTAERARAFAERESKKHGVRATASASAEEAVRGADVVCTTTSSKTPVLLGEWLAPGAHVNAAGASVAAARELDGAAVARSRLFVDRRESALAEAGDFLMARAEGLIGDDHIAGELGEVALGRVRGRTSPSEITLFKSVGIAVEDVAAAHEIHRRAAAEVGGQRVVLGGTRHD